MMVVMSHFQFVFNFILHNAREMITSYIYTIYNEIILSFSSHICTGVPPLQILTVGETRQQ